MTTPGTTDVLVTDTEETAAGLALAAGLDAVAGLYDEALDRIAHLAETWEPMAAPDDDVVVRLAERPIVGQRADAVAA